ncbi:MULTISPECIES: LpqN/LpqT family lipoprotein [Mycolicibacterium]|uniref:Sensor domain-containing protein n=1 Tax=Mycolicibacterium mageritense TaxID=53462 RepID=A0ABN5Y1R2_MYCME|nr:LpqN/LpqT family lipoprotein [Mycolicibacterium mageritense]MBN3457642.1 hypothetical protein [Mycobacterium sp. DSM 3803]OKH77692.1 hypothetical protein EB73_41620 [Mycobacterium sp. SWH-M3]MCC9183873.1 LpqN/LpqT family lipoprotein [Mycolicibacterium mageritense]CDO23853.1 hypothetical protein BN978_04342 [Mycolicibacterium mageritense DSM 44476 = CIP 104973]BBX31596.1 hypothetical protein MMAGJ_08780 [Mycolicibacterium mageritense]
MRTASKCAAVLLASAVLLTSACTRYADDATATAGPELLAAAKSGELKCHPVDVPLVEIERVDDDEPTLKIPTPPGWNRVTGKDTDLLRYTMVNRDLSTFDFAPTAVAALESVPDAMEADAVFAAQRKSIVGLGVPESAMDITDHELCGLPAQTVRYQVPEMNGLRPHPATALFVAYQTELRTYCAGLTIQTTAPDNLTYKRDAETILTGFQVLPSPHA